MMLRFAFQGQNKRVLGSQCAAAIAPPHLRQQPHRPGNDLDAAAFPPMQPSSSLLRQLPHCCPQQWQQRRFKTQWANNPPGKTCYFCKEWVHKSLMEKVEWHKKTAYNGGNPRICHACSKKRKLAKKKKMQESFENSYWYSNLGRDDIDF
jgi:hypothetical protein